MLTLSVLVFGVSSMVILFDFVVIAIGLHPIMLGENNEL